MFRFFILGVALMSFQLNAADLPAQFDALFLQKEAEIEVTPTLIAEYFLEEAKARIKAQEKVNVISFRINAPYHMSGKSKKDAKIWDFLCSIAASSYADSPEKKQKREGFLDQLKKLTGVQWSVTYNTENYYCGDEQESTSYLEIRGLKP